MVHYLVTVLTFDFPAGCDLRVRDKVLQPLGSSIIAMGPTFQ